MLRPRPGPIPCQLGGDGQLASATIHVSLAAFFAVMIVLLWVLASRLDALAMARAAARLFSSQAGTDALTGLPNRRQIDDQLDRGITRAHRHTTPLSVLLVDIDRFKTANDLHGHQAGDRALQEIASRLLDTVRGSDFAGRWGGEEFLLIAPRIPITMQLLNLQSAAEPRSRTHWLRTWGR